MNGTGYLQELRDLIEAHKPSRVLEWGSGKTTVLLATLGIETLTIDHHADYQAKVMEVLPPGHRVTAVVADLDGARETEADPGLAYSTLPLGTGLYDLVIVDGRRRVECACAASLCLSPGGAILLHDYRRERYWILMRLFPHFEDREHWRIFSGRVGGAK